MEWNEKLEERKGKNSNQPGERNEEELLTFQNQTTEEEEEQEVTTYQSKRKEGKSYRRLKNSIFFPKKNTQ